VPQHLPEPLRAVAEDLRSAIKLEMSLLLLLARNQMHFSSPSINQLYKKITSLLNLCVVVNASLYDSNVDRTWMPTNSLFRTAPNVLILCEEIERRAQHLRYETLPPMSTHHLAETFAIDILRFGAMIDNFIVDLSFFLFVGQASRIS
jgi:hypothetical protein